MIASRPRVRMARRYLLVIIVAMAMAAISVVVRAQIAQSASSSAFGESVAVIVTPLVGLTATVTSGPLPTAAGAAPPPYNVSNTVASVTVSASAAANSGLLQTGILTANATSNVPGSNTTTANATVNNLNLDAVAFAGLLGIDATTVRSSVQIDGTCGATLNAVATTLIEGGQAFGSLLGVGGSVAINASPPPNFVLLNVAGIRVVLNEQSIAGNGVTLRSATVNAIHVYFTNAPVALLGILNGDIVIGHSEAQVQCAATTSADVALTIVDTPDPVTAGNNLTCTITATNNGPGTATGVVVSDPLPSGVTFVSSSQPGCTHSAGVVTCQPVSLISGASAGVAIVVRPNNPGSLTNTATVTSTSTDPNPGNNNATAITTVTQATTSADVALTKSDSPDPVAAGGNLTYTLTATNNGPDAATGVVVTDTLPSGVTFVSSSQATCTHSAGVVTCQPVSLSPGASASVAIVVRPNSPGSLANTATVTSTSADPDSGNNVATTTTTVVAVVPTINDIGLIALAILLAAIGFWSLRRRGRGMAGT